MKKIIILIGFIVLLFSGFIFYRLNLTDNIVSLEDLKTNNYLDATYIINGEKVTLKNGFSEVNLTNSASKNITRYFGNEVKVDLNKDGREDTVFLLTQETGGTGTFFYVVAALKTEKNGYIGSHGLFLGDRIAPQTTNIVKDNIVLVNYAERKTGEGFEVAPSIGKSIWLLLNTDTMQFGEVVQNFEGEADPSRMTLGMNTWRWIKTIYNNDTETRPRIENKFTLKFNDDKTFSVTTDCNTTGGEYVLDGNKISFGNMFSTLMYCEGSQEGDFIKTLEQVQSYVFTSKGELIFNLKFDSGSFIFR